ncbi:MAG: GatB/YqeY domain-containing protein [Lachnospiraceae bacterium]|nr:GatB/YqeY domain-containing protein [Lachnospiraceae bacterium]
MEFSKLQKDMMQAMKDRDKQRKDSISALVSAAKKLAIDAGCRDDIPEEMVDQAILKEVKSVKEQIDTCPESRQDLLEEYKARLAVMEEYAPKMMSAEDVEAFIKEKFADVLASGNKGLVMKNVMPELKGKADGKVINQVVASLCAK